MNEKLVVLIYTILRDLIPAGNILKIVQDLEWSNGPYRFTNNNLELLAREILSRVTSED